MGIIGLVLLLACFNVANLLLARAVERERDMGIRTALGAKPARLMRLVVTEGFVIATLSGVLALLLAWWTQSLVGSFAIPIEQPQHLDLTPDLTVVAVHRRPRRHRRRAARPLARACGRAGRRVAGARLAGWQLRGRPALAACGDGWSARRSPAPPRSSRLAALFIQSFGFLSDANWAFDAIGWSSPSSNRRCMATTPMRRERYVDALLARVRALPGVTDVRRGRSRAVLHRLRTCHARCGPTAGTCEAGRVSEVATLAAGAGYFRDHGDFAGGGPRVRGRGRRAKS